MSWLQTQIKQNSNRLFIQEWKKQHSITDVGSMAKIYSQALLKKGVMLQDRIIILLSGGVEMVELILACFEIGAVAIPVSTKFTKSELEKILITIQPKLIITSWDIKPQVSSSHFQISCIEELPNITRWSSEIKNFYTMMADDTAAIILTSGTTGTPKAVQLSYGNFEASCNNWNAFLNFQPNDQFLCCLPLYHIGGLAVMLRALLFGFSVNLISAFETKLVLDTILRFPVSIISLVPTMLKRILDLGGGLEALKKLRWILLGGGPCPEYLLDLCIKEKLNIVKVYGMTESCSATVGLKLLEESHNKFYAGYPFPGAKVWTENNELHISGPMVMKGYLGEENINGCHNSHDLGRVDEDGLVFLDIRRKDLIVSGGENVNPIEVEEALMNINGIIDAAVLGVKNDEWGQKVVSYVVFNDKLQMTNVELRNILLKNLSPYKIPKEFISIPSIPRNELGKIEYGRLNTMV